VWRIIRVKLRHHAKFRRDRSNRCRDIGFLTFIFAVLLPVLSRLHKYYIFRFFKMVAVRHLGFLKVRNFNCRSGSEGQYASSCQMRCRLVKPLPRYRNIFNFLGCRQPPSWISLDLKFVTDQTFTRAELRHHAIFRWNRWNCGRDMAIFSISQNGGGRHVGFLKLQSCNCGTNHKCRTASPCQISCRLERSNRCRDISILDFSRWWQPQSWIFKILHF